MEALAFISLLALGLFIAYLWIYPEFSKGTVEKILAEDVSTQTDQKYFRNGDGFPATRTTRTDFVYSLTAYCDTGVEASSTLDLLPNASYTIESAGKGFVRITITPIEGAESTSVILTAGSFLAMAGTSSRLIKSGIL